MTSEFALPRKFVVFGIIIPLAIIVGYYLSSPFEFFSITLVGLLLFVLSIPLLLRWHHLLLILSWNAVMSLFFLPGQPDLWMLVALVSFTFSVLIRIMNKDQGSLFVPSVIWPLFFLLLVLVITAKSSGGFGVRALGGATFGGRRYINIVLAVLGYLALVGQRIPSGRASLYVTLYFLSAITPIMSNLAFFGGPSFYFLYNLFPVYFALEQAHAEFSVVGSSIGRLTGFALAGSALAYALLIRYGLRGILSRVWRGALFLGLLVLGAMGGFRSTIVMMGLLCVCLFYFEKLFPTHLLMVLFLAVVLGAALVPLAERLPLSMQRSLSFLPIHVNPIAAADARNSTEWRLRVWKILLPQVPNYLWLGKGFGIDATDFYLTRETVLRYGFAFEPDIIVTEGDWLGGRRTLIIPLGIWGVIGFAWFAIASLRILYRNYSRGPPKLKLINTFLLSYFLMRLIYFWVVYGHFAEDLFVFTGCVGLSISLNGVLKKGQAPEMAGELTPSKDSLAPDWAPGHL